MAEVKKELKPCPFCGRSIDIEKNVYEPSRDWHPTFMDPDSGGDPIKINCKCGLMFCTGTYDWGEFVEAWSRRSNEPTAYDPDKVVKQLEKLKSLVPVNRVLDDIVNDKPKELGMLIAYEKAIEIVKAGGGDA